MCVHLWHKPIKLTIMKTAAFQSKYNYPVYIIKDGEVKEMTMQQYLEWYWSDETTTPEGVAPRTQVRAILVDRDGNLLNYSRYEYNLDPSYYEEEDGWQPNVQYGTFTWMGANGSGPFVWNNDVYNSYEEAYETVLDKMYSAFQTFSSDAPPVYSSYEEALQYLQVEDDN